MEKTLRDLIMNLRRRSGLRTALNFQGKAVGPEKDNSCHQWIVFKVLSKLLPGLESGRTGNGGRGVTGEHLQVSFFSPETRFMCHCDPIFHIRWCRNCRECLQATVSLVSLSTSPSQTQRRSQKESGALGFTFAGDQTLVFFYKLFETSFV